MSGTEIALTGAVFVAVFGLLMSAAGVTTKKGHTKE